MVNIGADPASHWHSKVHVVSGLEPKPTKITEIKDDPKYYLGGRTAC